MQVGTFFNCAGPSAQEVSSHFSWIEEEETAGLPNLLAHFDAYCDPRRNVVRERFEFYSRSQKAGESITAFLAELRKLVSTCEFPDQDSMIRDRLVMGVRDRATQRALLRQSKLTLQEAIDIAISEEASTRDQQSMGIPRAAESMQHLMTETEVSAVQVSQPNLPARQCQFCTRVHIMKRSSCPAWGKTCNTCGGRDHFSAGCQSAIRPQRFQGRTDGGGGSAASRPRNARSADSAPRARPRWGNPGRRDVTVAAVDTGDYGPPAELGHGGGASAAAHGGGALTAETDDEEALYTVGAVREPIPGKPQGTRVFKTLVSESGESLRFLVDSGSECNVLSLSDYLRVTRDHSRRHVQSGVSAIRMYDGSLVSTLGRVNLRLTNVSSGRKVVLKCRIVDGDVMPILSLQSSVDLGLIEVKDVDPLDYVPKMFDVGGPRGATKDIGGSTMPLTKSRVLTEFQRVFDTDTPGRVVHGHTIVTDPQIAPVAEPPRRVRVHIRDRLRQKLDEMVAKKLISPVTEPTPWVSNLVIVDKPNGDIRICLDPKTLNKAIQREHYPTPTIDEVTTRLSDAKIFSVVDASQAFWQIGLDDASAKLCTFHTPFGRYRFEVVPYGIRSAPELWQRTMHELVAGLRGVEVIADDFIVFGSTEADHDANLRAFLRRAEERNLRLNADKFRCKVRSVKWMGHILSDQGLKADPARVQAITDMPVPTSVPELKRFLGMVGYISRFLPNLSEVLAPLRQLTQRSVEWYWSMQCQQSFDRVKCLITTAPVLRFYDPRREATVQCDASMSGLGACLFQDGNPVMYCSRALTSAEKAYSQIEKELLAITYALVRLDQFLYARPVTVITDHKPLVAIQTKPLGDAPLRLQRMLMTIQRYDYTIVYQPGSQMYVADTLSRASLPLPQDIFAAELEQVDLSKGVSVSPKRLEMIRTATASDPVLSQLISQIQVGWPDRRQDVPPIIRCYFPFREELTVQDGLVFKYRRLMVPRSQQAEVLAYLHRSHLGLASTVRLARECVFWLGMYAELREVILKCPVCLAHRPAQAKEPLRSHEVPDRPWQRVATDLFELNGVTYVVLVDYYSGYVEVDRLPSSSTAQVLRALSVHFARYGIPEVLVSDNGPQYASAEFADFTQELDIDHRTSSPTFPQSNGRAENAVKTVKALWRKALASGQDPMWALLMWRNAPNETTGVSPAQLMFGRQCRTFLPTARSNLSPRAPVDVRQHLVSAKARQAQQFNRGAKPLRPLVEGETVRMRLPGRSTWSAGICLRSVADRSYLVRVDNAVYRRNRRHLLATGENPAVVAQDPVERPLDRPPPAGVIRPQPAAPPRCPVPGPAVPQEGCLRGAQGEGTGIVTPPPAHSPPPLRRSNRVSRPPTYLQDYIT